MVFIFYELFSNLLNLLFRSQQAASIQPIVPLPGLFVSYETFPYLVLALSIVVVSHELSHGIASLGDQCTTQIRRPLLRPRFNGRIR